MKGVVDIAKYIYTIYSTRTSVRTDCIMILSTVGAELAATCVA